MDSVRVSGEKLPYVAGHRVEGKVMASVPLFTWDVIVLMKIIVKS